MSENLTLLTETAERMFADLAAEPEKPFADLWPVVAEASFGTLLIAEAEGGFGGDWLDVAAVLRLAGLHALAAPLAETILATKLLADAGLAAGDGITTLAGACQGQLDGNRFSGLLKAVAWGRDATTIAAAMEGKILLLRRADAVECLEGVSPAGDPRDRLRFDGAAVESAPSPADPFALGALTRACLMAGALDAALERSIAYANERVQFGKPIGKFQAVQQALAVFAEEAAAVNCAAQAAAKAAMAGDAGFEIAAAKLRANMAAAQATSIAHQVHGAIGFTHECGLHRWTRRLIAWSSEFGSERYWSETLGQRVAGLGPEGLWAEITRRSDLAV